MREELETKSLTDSAIVEQTRCASLSVKRGANVRPRARTLPLPQHAWITIPLTLVVSGCASLGNRPKCDAAYLTARNAPYTDFYGLSRREGEKESDAEHARRMYLFAQMSKNAYPEDDRVREPHFVLPDSVHAAGAVEDARTGFAARVFLLGDSLKPSRIAIAFRGTEGFPIVGKDWRYGNWGARQQRQAIAFYDSVRTRYSPPGWVNTPPIVVTGHSLGGALAIQVSVVRPNVLTYVFNTSYRKVLAFRDDTLTNERVSASETTEAAKLVRGLLPNPTILHIPTFNCTRGNPFRNHGIARLARCMTRVAAVADQGARESLARNAPTCAMRAQERDKSPAVPTVPPIVAEIPREDGGRAPWRITANASASDAVVFSGATTSRRRLLELY